MRKGKTSVQTKSTAAVPVADGTARWLSGDSGAHLILHVTLDRDPEDGAFHAKVFTCKVKCGKTGATLARASVDLANYANIDESNAECSPRGLERSYATTLDFFGDISSGDETRRDAVRVSAAFVVTAMDITPPPDASPSERLSMRRKSERHLSLDEFAGSDGDSDGASSLGPDEDVADDSQSESASVFEDPTPDAEIFVDVPASARRKESHRNDSKNVSFVDDFGEDDELPATTALERNANASRSSSERSEDDDDDGPRTASDAGTKPDSDPAASRLRWARAAMALGVPPPSPPRSEATESVDGDDDGPRDAARDGGVGGSHGKRKKSMLGLYSSPSKKNAAAPGAASRFQAAARKIHAAGRFGGASFAASGSESGFGKEPGVSLSLLDELNAEPDVASVAKAETAANDTELTRRHRSAVDEAVESLKDNAMFSETLGSFETTRALASTLEAALFERTSDVELAWETKAAAMRVEIERLTRLNEAAAEATATMRTNDAYGGEARGEPTAAGEEDARRPKSAPIAGEEGKEGKEGEGPFDDAAKASASSTRVGAFGEGRILESKHSATNDDPEDAVHASPVKAAPRKLSGTPPGSPSALFQRAARVGALEEEIERLALESQKLKLEALSEKKLADKARAQALEAGKSLRDARASIDDELVHKVAVATSALRAEIATLQGDHDMLASAVSTLTEERDAARADASAEATRALQTAADEKASVVRERDAFAAELDVS
jgi:hypothetical protein